MGSESSKIEDMKSKQSEMAESLKILERKIDRLLEEVGDLNAKLVLLLRRQNSQSIQ